MERCVIEKKALAPNIEALSSFADESLRKSGLSDDRRQELMMALDEAITNVVMHSYGRRKGNLRIEIRSDGDAVEVELTDQGKAFDPTAYPEPDLNIPLEERRAGGMGVPLMKRLADGLKYYRENGRNHFILRKKARIETCQKA
jgi:serine/threonine-protein kinase RsbW